MSMKKLIASGIPVINFLSRFMRTTPTKAGITCPMQRLIARTE